MNQTRNISKSMMSYLKRAREHKEFLLRETKEFERGKRHLANIMGIESEEMTQTDIDEAISYLFPSGLFDKRSRPQMKHPDLLFRAQKDAQFDIEGRPHHHLFYTTKPNYYESISTLRKHIRQLNQYEDEQIAKGYLDSPEDAKYNFSGRAWLSITEMCEMFLEKMSDADYAYFTKCLVHLSNHPYSNRVKEYLDEHSKQLEGQSLNLELPEILRDETTGQVYTEMTSRRREHEVLVRTVLNGSGIVKIEDKDILYFDAPYLRKAILFPLQLAYMVDKVDIYAEIVRKPKRLGQSAIAGAIRSAVSLSIAAYTDPITRERMRLAGLLTIDTRLRERKKFGQMKARRKYTWKKR